MLTAFLAFLIATFPVPQAQESQPIPHTVKLECVDAKCETFKSTFDPGLIAACSVYHKDGEEKPLYRCDWAYEPLDLTEIIDGWYDVEPEDADWSVWVEIGYPRQEPWGTTYVDYTKSNVIRVHR